MTSIRFERVGKRFGPNDPPVLRGVDLSIEAGEFCVFVGPSGCGKSTLLRLIAGLEDVSEGDLFIGERRVNDLPPAERGVAMVFQSYALYPHMTVAENMAFGLRRPWWRSTRAEREAIARRVREAAAKLELADHLHRLPRELSGGQRQRVAIGRAIVKEPRAFLFDEPLSNLDASLRAQTRLEIARLHREVGGASMVYVTHDQVEAMTLADKIVLLRAGPEVQRLGSVAQIGSPMALYHRPQSLFAARFIGSPAMNLLPGTLRDAQAEQAEVEVAGHRVRVAVDARHLASGAAVQIGVRPERVAIDASQATFTGTVRHVERLGDASLLHADPGHGLAPVVVRLPGHAGATVGDALGLVLAPEQLHLFAEDGVAAPRTVDLPL